MSETAPTHSTAAVSEQAAAPSPAAAVSEQGNTAATDTTTQTPAATSKPQAAPKEATASSASKDNAAAGKPSVIEQVKRYIPGLGSKDEPAKTSKRKKSGKKSSSAAADVAHAKDPALATATLETAPSREELPKELQASGRPRIAGLNGTPAEEEADTKKFSAAAYVQKRLRTNNKKIQKLQTYEAQTTPLNEDQKKSLQQKPVLEAIQRELGEISKAFEAEEADEAKRAEKQKKAEEQRIQHRVAAAVSDEKNDLALLLQFLHLYSLFNPGQSTQYSQTAVPPVVANATAQQHRAVHELFQNLANGPLIGTGDDAVSHIENLRSGSSKPVIEGVTFADVKQMILDLTAGPAEMGHELPSSEAPHASSAAGAEVPAINVGGDQAGAPASGLNFMQASEIESGSAQPGHSTAGIALHPVSGEIGSNAATPGFGNTPAVEKTESAANGIGWENSTAPAMISPETLPKKEVSGWEEAPDPVKSWADEVDESHPANPFTATPDLPADAQEQQATSGPIVDADGFIQETRGGRGGSRGRGDGRGRVGRGGRGRGGASSGDWQRREPRGEGHHGGERGDGEGRRGSFRGGRGRGEGHRGEFRGGRGGNRGRPQSGSVPTTATAGEA